MSSLIFFLIWCVLYIHSPYLFVGFCGILYYLNWNNGFLNILITVPLNAYYIIQQLKKGEQSQNNRILPQIIRWIISLIVFSFECFEEAETSALKLYAYISLATILFHAFNIRDIHKHYMYSFGFLWIIIENTQSLSNLIVVLLFHSFNFYIDVPIKLV